MAAVVFDLDGTLVDSAPDLHLVLDEIMGEMGYRAPPLPALRQMVGEGARVLLRRALDAAGATADAHELERLYAAFIERYTADPCRASVLFPGALASLDRLAARGVPLGLCTNKPQAPTEGLLRALGVMGRFGAVVGGDVLATRKPDPVHLVHVLSGLDATAQGAVLVGDSRTDLLTARAAGVPCVLVSFGYTTVPARDLGADAVIDHFDELDAALDRLAAAA